LIDWSTIKHFTASEFQCHCGCGANEIKQELVEKLDMLRGWYGKPMVVTSGYRCPGHNQAVSTTGQAGPHTTGYAADIAASGADAFTLLKLAFATGFTGIGVSQKGASRFIHMDIVPGQTRPMIWSY